jgi:hypothetical protein
VLPPVEEEPRVDVEELSQRLQVLLGRVALAAGAQLPDVHVGDDPSTPAQLLGDLPVAVRPSPHRMHGTEQQADLLRECGPQVLLGCTVICGHIHLRIDDLPMLTIGDSSPTKVDSDT